MGQSGSPTRIAILPLENVSPDPADSYFADGLTDELISTASKVKELEVISRTSSMLYKNRPRTIRKIARELNVGTILEGSVRKSGNRVRITIQMVDAKRDRQLWTESYDRELQDIFAIQSEVARHVADTLMIRLLSSEKTEIGRRSTENTEAHLLYLKGLNYLAERTRRSLDRAARYFETAVEKDPRFALSYAALARYSVIRASYGWVEPSGAHSKARLYASKALELNPRLAEPHATLGYLLAMHDYRWIEGEEELKEAEVLNPSYAGGYMSHSLVLRGMRRFDEAYEKMRRAADLDPLSMIIGVNVAETLLVLGKTKEAISQSEKIVDANPTSAVPHRFLAWAYLTDSKADLAVTQAMKAEEFSDEDVGVRALLAASLGFANRRNEADKIIEELLRLAKTTYVNNVMLAHAFFGAGRLDEAFAFLKRGLKERSELLVETRWWPWLKDLRKDPRWISIESRMGFSGASESSINREPGLEPNEEPEFLEAPARVTFDFLVRAFIDDYMKRRLYIEQSGWRSLSQISQSGGIPLGTLYGKKGRYGPSLNELVSKGLVEQRTFIGHRGRGGSVTKVRVAYDREPTRRYVDRAALL